MVEVHDYVPLFDPCMFDAKSSFLFTTYTTYIVR